MSQTFRSKGFTDEKLLEAMTSVEPQAEYVAFSARCPVLHKADGTVTVTRYADALAVNQSRSVLGNGHSGPGIVGARSVLIPLDLDGEEHRRWRKLLDPLFSPKRVNHLEGEIRQRARALLDTIAEKGEADVFHSWCRPLPASIFLGILGLPQDDRDYMLEMMESQLHPDPAKSPEENSARQKAGAARCYEYLEAMIAERQSRTDPGDDFVGWLLKVEDDDGNKLSSDDVKGVMYLFVLAGLDTVSCSLANMLSILARYPEKRKELLERPELWPNAIEEMLRFDPTIPLATRKTLEDLVLPSGDVIEANTVIDVSWPSANLDPDVFENPLDLDFERESVKHMAFASGWHRCLGSHLARLELRVALQEFHARIPNYEIKPGFELDYSFDPRAPWSLPLVWDVTAD